MEIGPISGIRAVTLLGQRKAESALAPRFEIDASARPDEDHYAPPRQQPDRGLEDEERETAEEEDSSPSNGENEPAPPSGRVSFFA